MIRIFFPGQNVPEWLEKVEVQEGGRCGSLKFANVNFIWVWKDEFHVVSLLPSLPAIKLSNAKNITLVGQRSGVLFHGSVLDVIRAAIRK